MIQASNIARRFRFVAAASLAGLAAGCSTIQSFIPNGSQPLGTTTATLGDRKDVSNQAQPATSASEKIVRLPLKPEDLQCPEVDIRDGGAALRVGGAENSSVRYQFEIVDVARECDPAGNQAGIKVGVKGRLIIGPAGSPGTYDAGLRVVVRRDADDKEVFAKTYRVSATATDSGSGDFSLVTEPIMLPLANVDLADDYSIIVGFGGDSGAPPGHKRAAR